MSETTIGTVYLNSVIKRFRVYKELGEKTFAQLEEKDLFYQPNEASNPIAVIVRHMSGNMLSRWTNFLTEDGEKSWRNRDTEFEPATQNRQEVMDQWEKGWDCLLQTLGSLTEADLAKTVMIRQEPHSVMDAINRQLAHYPYHVGQIVYIAKLIRDRGWESLSIPKGGSEAFNRNMMK